MTARVLTGDGLTTMQVTQAGLVTQPRNWPRALHEGNWSPLLAPALNILVSVVFIGLWTTGLFIWVRRTLKRRRRKPELTLQPAAQGR